jgi:hypothetical protein
LKSGARQEIAIPSEDRARMRQADFCLTQAGVPGKCCFVLAGVEARSESKDLLFFVFLSLLNFETYQAASA